LVWGVKWKEEFKEVREVKEVEGVEGCGSPGTQSSGTSQICGNEWIARRTNQMPLLTELVAILCAKSIKI